MIFKIYLFRHFANAFTASSDKSYRFISSQYLVAALHLTPQPFTVSYVYTSTWTTSRAPASNLDFNWNSNITRRRRTRRRKDDESAIQLGCRILLAYIVDKYRKMNNVVSVEMCGFNSKIRTLLCVKTCDWWCRLTKQTITRKLRL